MCSKEYHGLYNHRSREFLQGWELKVKGKLQIKGETVKGPEVMERPSIVTEYEPRSFIVMGTHVKLDPVLRKHLVWFVSQRALSLFPKSSRWTTTNLGFVLLVSILSGLQDLPIAEFLIRAASGLTEVGLKQQWYIVEF